MIEGPGEEDAGFFVAENPDPNGCGNTFLVEISGGGNLLKSTFNSMGFTAGPWEMPAPGT